MIQFDEYFSNGWFNHHLDVHVSLHGNTRNVKSVSGPNNANDMTFRLQMNHGQWQCNVDFRDVASPVNQLGEIDNL